MVRISDPVDKKIVHELAINAKISNTELGKRVGISEAGIRKRIAKLEETGTIIGYTVRLSKQGAIKAIILASVESIKNSKNIIKEIQKFPEVIRAGEVSGKIDLFFECIFLSQEELNSFVDSVASMDEIVEVHSNIILEEYNATP